MTTTTVSDPFAQQEAQAAATGRTSLRGLLPALRPALQWRLMLLWLLALLLPTLVAALPVWRMLGAAFDHTVGAPAVAQGLDLVAIADLRGVYDRYASAITGGSGIALAMTLLLSPLLTGAAIGAARAPAPLGFAALVGAGVREYGRLLRMLLWAVVPLGAAVFLGAAGFDAADEHAARALLASSAAGAALAASLAAGLLLLLAYMTLDAGRAMLALDRRRTSAVLAWRDGLGLIARRPLAVLALYVGVTTAGLLLAGLLAVARLNVPALGAGSLLGGMLLAQLAVLALAWMRCARLFGLMELARGMRTR